MELGNLLNHPSSPEAPPAAFRGTTAPRGAHVSAAIRSPFRGHGNTFEFPSLTSENFLPPLAEDDSHFANSIPRTEYDLAQTNSTRGNSISTQSSETSGAYIYDSRFHTPTNSESTIDSDPSNSHGLHSRLTSVSSFNSQHPGTEPGLGPDDCQHPFSHPMAQPNHRGTGAPAGLLVPSYVQRIRDKVGLCNDNDYVTEKTLSFQQKLGIRRKQLNDMYEAAHKDLLESRIRCTGLTVSFNEKDNIICGGGDNDVTDDNDDNDDNDGEGVYRTQRITWPIRKVVSQFFGRNKGGTRRIEEHVWVIMCRKHYQRTSYRMGAKFPEIQAELCEVNLFKVKIWSSQNEANVNGNGNRQGPVIAHWRLQPKRNQGKAPLDGWLKDMVDSNQKYTTDQMIELMFRIRVELMEQTRVNMPDLEILPTWRGDPKPAPKAAPKHCRSKSTSAAVAARKTATAARRNRSLTGLPLINGSDMGEDSDDQGDARGMKRRRMDPSPRGLGQPNRLVPSYLSAQAAESVPAPFLPSLAATGPAYPGTSPRGGLPPPTTFGLTQQNGFQFSQYSHDRSQSSLAQLPHGGPAPQGGSHTSHSRSRSVHLPTSANATVNLPVRSGASRPSSHTRSFSTNVLTSHAGPLSHDFYMPRSSFAQNQPSYTLPAPALAPVQGNDYFGYQQNPVSRPGLPPPQYMGAGLSAYHMAPVHENSLYGSYNAPVSRLPPPQYTNTGHHSAYNTGSDAEDREALRAQSSSSSPSLNYSPTTNYPPPPPSDHDTTSR